MQRDEPTQDGPPGASETVTLEGRARYVATPLAAIWGIVPGVAGFVALGSIAALNEWISGYGERGWWLYVGLFAACSGIGLLPTYAMSMIGGWIFGAGLGTLGAVSGFLGGALIGYGITKLAAGDAFQRWLDAKPKARVIREAFVAHGPGRMLGTVIALRFPPSSPFSLMNFVLTASGVRLVPYVLGTAVGMTPRTVVAVLIAAAAAAGGAKDFQSLFAKRTPEFIAGLVVTMIVVVVLAQIGQRALAKAGLTVGEATKR